MGLDPLEYNQTALLKRRIYICFLLLLFCVFVRAEKEPKTARTKGMSLQGSVQFKFTNHLSDFAHKDSVLLIFDRYDRTGAGIVYQVFYVDRDGNINIPALRTGKYYVTIQCLGLHRDRMEKIVSVRSKKSKKVKINLRDSEEFSKDNVVIPVFHPKFSDMAILKMK